MARFARMNSQIRTNRLILANRFRVPELDPFLRISIRGAKKIANRRFEAIRANRSHVMNIGVLLRIDLRESIRANGPDSHCESPGHLRSHECGKQRKIRPSSRDSRQSRDFRDSRDSFVQ